MSVEKKELVEGIICPECEDAIWSRSGHDFRYCSCKASFVDGGRNYLRCGGPLDRMLLCMIDPETDEVVEIKGPLLNSDEE